MIPRHVPALALGTLALGVAEFSMMSILLPVADDLGVTVPEAGHFISAYAAGVCAGVLIMAAAARKMPLKTLLLIIVGIITLGNTLTVFVGSYHLMLFSRFIAGLPHGAYFGAAGVLCTQLAEPGKASRDMCLMVAGMTIANLAGVPLASFLAWAVSWRAAFAIAAAAALITFAAIASLFPKCRHCPTADLPHNSDSCAVSSPGSCLARLASATADSSLTIHTSIPSWNTWPQFRLR